MKKSILLLSIVLLFTVFSNAQSNDVKLHIKTFNDADGTFTEREDFGTDTIYYFNELFDELYIFVEIDPTNLEKYYIKPNEYQPFTLKLTTTKGNVLLKEFKKPVGFSSNGVGLNKCFLLFQLNKVGFGSFKIKADLMRGNNIIRTTKKTVYISFGE